MTPKDHSRAVLITGCSSGIGHAIALRWAKGAWKVYATARKPETLKELADAGCRTLALDVTDEASMLRAVNQVEAEAGAGETIIWGDIDLAERDKARREISCFADRRPEIY